MKILKLNENFENSWIFEFFYFLKYLQKSCFGIANVFFECFQIWGWFLDFLKFSIFLKVLKNHVLASLMCFFSVSRYGDDFWKISVFSIFRKYVSKILFIKIHQRIINNSSKQRSWSSGSIKELAWTCPLNGQR